MARPNNPSSPPGNKLPVLDDYTFNLGENTNFSQTVSATGLKKNDIVTYSFFDSSGTSSTYTAPDGTVFTIDSPTGQITSSGTVNYEDTQSYVLSVKATDKFGGYDTSVVTINVTDTDEFNVTAPIDSDDAPNSAQEGAAPGTVVGLTALARDADGSDNTVTYSLVTDATGSTVLTDGPFQVDPVTGVVTVRDGSLLDYDTANSSKLYINASSSDGSHSVSDFTIDVTDDGLLDLNGHYYEIVYEPYVSRADAELYQLPMIMTDRPNRACRWT